MSIVAPTVTPDAPAEVDSEQQALVRNLAAQPGQQGRPDRHPGLFLGVAAVLWLVPLLWTVYTSLRPQQTISTTIRIFPSAARYSLDNYFNAWNRRPAPAVLQELVDTSPCRQCS